MLLSCDSNFMNYAVCNCGGGDGTHIIIVFETDTLPEKSFCSTRYMLFILNITEVEFYPFTFHFFGVFRLQVIGNELLQMTLICTCLRSFCA